MDTYNIPIELNSLGNYTIKELKEKLTNYAQLLISVSKRNATFSQTNDLPKTQHSAWVQSMAKYRVLPPMNEKKEFLEELDERFNESID